MPRGVFCGAGQVLHLLGPAVEAHPTEEVLHGEEGRSHRCRPQAGELTLQIT